MDVSNPTLSAIFSNLEKASDKQLRAEEAALFGQLARYFKDKCEPAENKTLEDLAACLKEELTGLLPVCQEAAVLEKDRGALRALTWGEKVTKIHSTLLARYHRQQDALLEDTNLFVCEICGFIFVGDEAPEICPICKVPHTKIVKIAKEV